jgi:hypothetical protein
MARTKPFPKSFLGCGTTSVSPETALLKTWWEPVTRTSVHPSRSKRLIISRLFFNMKEVPPSNNMTGDYKTLARLIDGDADQVAVEPYTRSTKLSTTFFSPAFSNAIVSLLPSIFTTLP